MKANKKFLIPLVTAAAMFIAIQACDSREGKCENKVSQSGGNESHNNGTNCMTCHVSGGSGEGCFTVAGSVYDSAGVTAVNTGTIRLFTGPNGTGSVAATIQVDSKGNFYTTDQVNFSGGLYPAFTSGNNTVFMSSQAPTGQCGSCHGVSQGKITAP